MCPLCISSMALAVIGATSTGAVSTFLARRFARLARGGKTQQSESKETIRHDDKPDRAPQGRLAS
jgi:hypothetical protein